MTQSNRLCPISAKIGHELSREIDTYAEAHGVTRSHAAAEYLDVASEVLREREGIPGSRADEVLEVLERLGEAAPFEPVARREDGGWRPVGLHRPLDPVALDSWRVESRPRPNDLESVAA
jgi:hypothetical protein